MEIDKRPASDQETESLMGDTTDPFSPFFDPGKWEEEKKAKRRAEWLRTRRELKPDEKAKLEASWKQERTGSVKVLLRKSKTALRIIGTLVIPFALLILTVVIGNMLAWIPTPWHDASTGNQDTLSLLGASFLGGIVFSASAHQLAPKHKNVATSLMIFLAVAFFVYGSSLVYDKVGTFGIVRYTVSVLGMIVCAVASRNKS